MASPHQPDEKSRKQVSMMSGLGLTHDQIALVLSVSDETLRKHYKKELATGAAKTTALVGQNLFNIATGSGQGAVTAAIFWMKTRAGWREVNRTEITGPDNGAVKVETTTKLDTRALDAEQREALKLALQTAIESDGK
jgi:hypothetical protein